MNKLAYHYLPFVYYAEPDAIKNKYVSLVPIKVGQLHRGDKVYNKEFDFIGTIKKIKRAKYYWNLKFTFRESISKKFSGTYQRQCYVLIDKENV